MGQCSIKPHKLDPPGATPGSATLIGYANRKSGHVESVANLWVRPPPRSLHLDSKIKTGCWSNGTTPALQAGNRGSIPRRSTFVLRTNSAFRWLRQKANWCSKRCEYFLWKVAGYGSPGRFAKPCDVKVMRVQIPCLPLRSEI